MKERMSEILWIAVKAAVITVIILILLQIVPVNVSVGVRQIDRSWDVEVDQSEYDDWDVTVR
ncbi:MAG: hypothetical protein ACYSWW_19690 [Planctomycetota bacterium]|jgi:hypothetical protein